MAAVAVAQRVAIAPVHDHAVAAQVILTLPPKSAAATSAVSAVPPPPPTSGTNEGLATLDDDGAVLPPTPPPPPLVLEAELELAANVDAAVKQIWAPPSPGMEPSPGLAAYLRATPSLVVAHQAVCAAQGRRVHPSMLDAALVPEVQELGWARLAPDVAAQIAVAFNHLEKLLKWPEHHTALLAKAVPETFRSEWAIWKRLCQYGPGYEKRVRRPWKESAAHDASGQQVLAHRLMLGLFEGLPDLLSLDHFKETYVYPAGLERDPRGKVEKFYVMTNDEVKIRDESRVPTVTAKFANGWVCKGINFDLVWRNPEWVAQCEAFAYKEQTLPNIIRTQEQILRYYGDAVAALT